MLDIKQIGPRLEEIRPGMWTAASSESVSYPTAGHDLTRSVEGESFWYRHRTACLTAAVSRHPPGGVIFDIGGGTGLVAASLTNVGHPTIVVEPGSEGAAIAWQRGVRPVINATTTGAGFLPATLPAVGLFDVVEHTEDDTSFMSHVQELLVPGGMAYITVPAHDWLWSSHDVQSGHFRRYTRSRLLGLLAGVGLEVVYLTTFFRPLPAPMFLLRSLPSRFGLRDPADNDLTARDLRRGGGIAATLRDALLRPEVRAIASGRRMAMGSSILAVVSKPS